MTDPKRAYIPYGRHTIEDVDVEAVARTLRSDWLTTGPEIPALEREAAAFLGVEHCVAVSSGTAALHCAMQVCDIGPGDEVLVPAITFAASANAAVYLGATPCFVDVEPETLLVDVEKLRLAITARTRAIVPVDYAGQLADYDQISALAGEYGLAIIADRCHSIGAAAPALDRAAVAKASAYSLHAVKHITAGEGGIVSVSTEEQAIRARRFRNHGISTDHRDRERLGAHAYDMVELGFNYRLTDLQASLARAQLARLPAWLVRRRELAEAYDRHFVGSRWIQPLITRPGRDHAHHIYVVALRTELLDCTRDDIFSELRAEGIGVNVHYMPVYFHSFYRHRFNLTEGLCPVAEAQYQRILTLPLFPTMTDTDVERVVATLNRCCDQHST